MHDDEGGGVLTTSPPRGTAERGRGGADWLCAWSKCSCVCSPSELYRHKKWRSMKAASELNAPWRALTALCPTPAGLPEDASSGADARMHKLCRGVECRRLAARPSGPARQSGRKPPPTACRNGTYPNHDAQSARPPGLGSRCPPGPLPPCRLPECEHAVVSLA